MTSHWVFSYSLMMGFLGGSAVKSLPAMQETQEMWIQSLAWEDPPEEEMAAHSSIPAGKVPETEEPGGLESMSLQSWTRLSTHTVVFNFCVSTDNPMQVLCPSPRKIWRYMKFCM